MCELNDDTPIYRIYSFFDLINTLNTNSIRLSQASRMEDVNELFGIYFDVLRSAYGPQSAEQVRQIQAEFRKAQSHHYMTCWTRASENLAVWSLYSPGKDAIQVQTTYGKLREAIFAHFKKYPYSLAYNLQPNDPTDLLLPPKTGSVQYTDFMETYSSPAQQCAEFFDEKNRRLKEHIDSGLAMKKWGKNGSMLKMKSEREFLTRLD